MNERLYDGKERKLEKEYICLKIYKNVILNVHDTNETYSVLKFNIALLLVLKNNGKFWCYYFKYIIISDNPHYCIRNTSDLCTYFTNFK